MPDLTEFSQNVNIKEMNKLCEDAFALRDKKEILNRQLKEINESLQELEDKLMAYLEEADLESFDGKDGKLSVVNHFSVRVPQSVDEKKAFAKYLEAKKIFWDMCSFNSRTVNSFFKQEQEFAVEQGNLEFKIPGLGDPSHSKSLSFRRKSQ